MTPADQHALREALARAVAPKTWEVADQLRDWPDSPYKNAHTRGCGPSLEAADRLIAGPLAPYLAAEAENTRLKETVEGLLPQKLCGESWGCPDEERVSITVTFGAIRVARSVLATIPPKENP